MIMLILLRSSGTLGMLNFDSVSTHIKFLSELPRQGQNIGRILIMNIYKSPIGTEYYLTQQQ